MVIREALRFGGMRDFDPGDETGHRRVHETGSGVHHHGHASQRYTY
jgi:hypothetical protein